jgi:membrane protein involved in colicin uptake
MKTAAELLILYDAWQGRIEEMSHWEELLDVENSPAEAATYELMLEQRRKSYEQFMQEYRSSTKAECERLRTLVLERRKLMGSTTKPFEEMAKEDLSNKEEKEQEIANAEEKQEVKEEEAESTEEKTSPV